MPNSQIVKILSFNFIVLLHSGMYYFTALITMKYGNTDKSKSAAQLRYRHSRSCIICFLFISILLWSIWIADIAINAPSKIATAVDEKISKNESSPIIQTLNHNEISLTHSAILDSKANNVIRVVNDQPPVQQHPREVIQYESNQREEASVRFSLRQKMIVQSREDTESISDKLRRLFNLGISNPRQLADLLEDSDPLQVAIDPDSFVCPTDARDRIDYPTLFSSEVLKDFRNQNSNSFIFYQHLR